jgi:hypothetical protein
MYHESLLSYLCQTSNSSAKLTFTRVYPAYSAWLDPPTGLKKAYVCATEFTGVTLTHLLG